MTEPRNIHNVTTYPPPVKEGREGDGNPHVPASAPTPKGPTSWRPRIVMGEITVQQIVAAIGFIVAAITWGLTRSSKSDVADAQKFAVKTCVDAIHEAIGPLPMRLDNLEKRESKTDQRWDAFDKWNSEAMARQFAPKPPKFGPTAERNGEAWFPNVPQ